MASQKIRRIFKKSTSSEVNMSRSLFISGKGLQQRGAEAYRVAKIIGGALKCQLIAQFDAAVTGHNHFEVSTMANANHVGVAG
jgi:hypothetical protein